MYISESEVANFWLDVMTDLQNRGVRDILVCCVDGLKGFPYAIQSVFPETSVLLCCSPPNPQLNQVCRKQASERVSEESQDRIRCRKQGFRIGTA